MSGNHRFASYSRSTAFSVSLLEAGFTAPEMRHLQGIPHHPDDVGGRPRGCQAEIDTMIETAAAGGTTDTAEEATT